MNKEQKKANQAKAQNKRQRLVDPVRQGPLAHYEEPDLRALQPAVARPDMAGPSDILALQRTVGNRAVQRYIQQSTIQRNGGGIPEIFDASNLVFQTKGSLYFKADGAAGRYRHAHQQGPQASVYTSLRQGSIARPLKEQYKTGEWFDDEVDPTTEFDTQKDAGRIQVPPQRRQYVCEVQDAAWQSNHPDVHVSETEIEAAEFGTGAWERIVAAISSLEAGQKKGWP